MEPWDLDKEDVLAIMESLPGYTIDDTALDLVVDVAKQQSDKITETLSYMTDPIAVVHHVFGRGVLATRLLSVVEDEPEEELMTSVVIMLVMDLLASAAVYTTARHSTTIDVQDIQDVLGTALWKPFRLSSPNV
jgi:hypothetical protein